LSQSIIQLPAHRTEYIKAHASSELLAPIFDPALMVEWKIDATL
jgi:hypothetical protein